MALNRNLAQIKETFTGREQRHETSSCSVCTSAQGGVCTLAKPMSEYLFCVHHYRPNRVWSGCLSTCSVCAITSTDWCGPGWSELPPTCLFPTPLGAELDSGLLERTCWRSLPRAWNSSQPLSFPPKGMELQLTLSFPPVIVRAISL